MSTALFDVPEGEALLDQAKASLLYYLVPVAALVLDVDAFDMHNSTALLFTACQRRFKVA